MNRSHPLPAWRPARWALTACAAMLVAGGCAQKAAPAGGQGYAQTLSRGLEVRLELPRTQLATGEQLTVTITARNATDSPINIESRGRNLALVRIYRDTNVGPERVKEYPQAALDTLVPWTLAPGKQRTWRLNLTVEPDWPQAEHLRLQAYVNGRPDASASMLIYVRGSRK